MSFWSETVTHIHSNHDSYRWEIATIDDGMIILRYQEYENRQWVTKEQMEMISDVAQIIFKDEFLPKVTDHD